MLTRSEDHDGSAAHNDFMGNDLSPIAEGGYPDAAVDGLARRGIRMRQALPWQVVTGSFSIVERNLRTAKLNACADPRLGGLPAGI
jgi:hypothetical protein